MSQEQLQVLCNTKWKITKSEQEGHKEGGEMIFQENTLLALSADPTGKRMTITNNQLTAGTPAIRVYGEVFTPIFDGDQAWLGCILTIDDHPHKMVIVFDLCDKTFEFAYGDMAWAWPKKDEVQIQGGIGLLPSSIGLFMHHGKGHGGGD